MGEERKGIMTLGDGGGGEEERNYYTHHVGQ